MPFGQILREALPPLRSVGTGLLQGQGETTQFLGQHVRRGDVVGVLVPLSLGASEQEVDRDSLRRRLFDHDVGVTVNFYVTEIVCHNCYARHALGQPVKHYLKVCTLCFAQQAHTD